MPPHRNHREARRQQAERLQHLSRALLEAGTLAPARTYDVLAQLDIPPDAPSLSVAVEPDTTQVVAQRLAPGAGVLIFASAARPGGGWLNGGRAQEEDISLVSSWATQAAQGGAAFYAQPDNADGAGPDRLLWADGLWLADAYWQLKEAPQAARFCAVAAPNLAHPRAQRASAPERIGRLARRLASALEHWQREGAREAVLGAIGCGVFQWPPHDSAAALAQAIAHHQARHGASMRLVLAMPDAQLAEIFQTVLGTPRLWQARRKGA